jgi:anti-sigma factor RsiW
MHVDPELLALLALGAAGTEDESAHVATCPVCAAELADLRRVVDLARSAATLTLAEPDPRVWAAVRREIEARLAPVRAAWSSASGEAELATDDLGRRLLQVSLHADLPSTGVRQAWLVHRDDPGQRQTLGVLDGRHGLWTVEHAIDLELYPILEISQQSIGSDGHSGQTIVRGELVPAA